MKEKEKNFKNVIVCVVCVRINPDVFFFFWNEKKISEIFLFSNQASAAAADQKIVETNRTKTSAYLLRKRITFSFVLHTQKYPEPHSNNLCVWIAIIFLREKKACVKSWRIKKKSLLKTKQKTNKKRQTKYHHQNTTKLTIIIT